MNRFVVQEHQGRSHHWDFRLEIGGVLKSWAVPKGPSLDPAEKHLAMQVPDHEMAHARYEGIIPKGSYGAGPVLIWDKGTFKSVEDDDAAHALKKGNLKFRLQGKRLKGEFALVKMHGPGREKAWLLIKKDDSYAKKGWAAPVLLTPARKRKLKEKVPACAVKER